MCLMCHVLRMAGGVPVRLCIEKKRMNLNWTKQKLLSAITDKTKMAVLPFRKQPDRCDYDARGITGLLRDVIKEHDLFVLSDEIYSELSYQGNHVSIAAIPGMKERSVVINGFSKSYAMTGWRLGDAVRTKRNYKTDDKGTSISYYECTDNESVCSD